MLGLEMNHFQYSGGEGVVIDPPAGSQGGGHDFRLGHQVQTGQVTKALSDISAVNVWAIEKSHVASIE